MHCRYSEICTHKIASNLITTVIIYSKLLKKYERFDWLSLARSILHLIYTLYIYFLRLFVSKVVFLYTHNKYSYNWKSINNIVWVYYLNQTNGWQNTTQSDCCCSNNKFIWVYECKVNSYIRLLFPDVYLTLIHYLSYW